jgi:outer membrane lipoprotein-sorting protein
MRTRSNGIPSIILLFLVLLIATSPAGAQQRQGAEAERIMAGLRERWKSMEGLSARFTHTFEWMLAGETQVTKGQLWLSGRDRFRIETDARVLVSDGALLWDYSPEQKQVLLNKMDPSRGLTTQQQLFAAYTEDATVEWVSEEGRRQDRRVVLRLTRPAGSDPAVVEVTVDPERMLVVRADYADSAGNRHHYALSDISPGPQTPERFVFKVPEGVRVVDMRPGPVSRVSDTSR